MKSNNVIKKKSNEENDYNFKRLKLKFLEKNDLKIFSSLCQDGIFSINEMIFDHNEKSFIATFSRFCWEFVDKGIKENKYFRVVSGIRVYNVKNIKYENLKNIDSSKFINLLSVDINKNNLILNFSSDITIKLLIGKIKIFLDDLDMPWPTGKKPFHK
ncbi:MAG: hypothetical protein CMN44_06835 [SAR116 cluster bacterium]|nr:hypothetical protein [SAR116 cluster bacterium]RPH09484.1 MAG: DUF2948 family protein [Alphaproteobacteria bacterium TMED54]|tara:strand:- start:812 stop:1285 length:474 start_codon:yes stop_codon:yes gene_type:complete